MISISTTTPKTVSNVVFEETGKSKLRDFPSRRSRTACLDGTCHIDFAAAEDDSDRTLDIRAQLTEAQADDLQTIFESETYVILSCRTGLFYGAMDILRISNGDLRLKFLVKEKMS